MEAGLHIYNSKRVSLKAPLRRNNLVLAAAEEAREHRGRNSIKIRLDMLDVRVLLLCMLFDRTALQDKSLQQLLWRHHGGGASPTRSARRQHAWRKVLVNREGKRLSLLAGSTFETTTAYTLLLYIRGAGNGHDGT